MANERIGELETEMFMADLCQRNTEAENNQLKHEVARLEADINARKVREARLKTHKIQARRAFLAVARDNVEILESIKHERASRDRMKDLGDKMMATIRDLATEHRRMAAELKRANEELRRRTGPA